MKSSCHSLTSFLHFFCSCQFRRVDSIQFQAHIPTGWHLEVRFFSTTTVLFCRTFPYNHFARTPRKTDSIVKETCLLIRCQAIDVLLLCEFACAGRCLPSRCLAMGIHVTISIWTRCQRLLSFSWIWPLSVTDFGLTNYILIDKPMISLKNDLNVQISMSEISAFPKIALPFEIYFMALSMRHIIQRQADAWRTDNW
jgi:hypothetical protein